MMKHYRMSLIRHRRRTFLLCKETGMQKWARMLVETGKAFVEPSAMRTQMKEDSDFWNLFWQLSREGNLHGSGMSHATTASPKPSSRAPGRVGGAVVDRGNAGWTTSKNGHICPCQSCSQRPPAEKTGRRSLLNRPSCSSDDPIGQGIELN